MAAGVAVALALWLLLPAVRVGEAGPPPIQDGEFTFLLPAGRKQCFYQSAPANASLETEYQVRGSRAPNSGDWGRGQQAGGAGQRCGQNAYGLAETGHALLKALWVGF